MWFYDVSPPSAAASAVPTADRPPRPRPTGGAAPARRAGSRGAPRGRLAASRRGHRCPRPGGRPDRFDPSPAERNAVRIGVPRESRPGETRVAATPRTVEAIRALGYAVFVQRGAGAASSFDDAAYARAGADVIDDAVWNADVSSRSTPRTTPRSRCCARGQVVACLLAPALNPAARRAAGGDRRDGAGHGCRPPHLAGPVAGRAVVDGEHRGLPGGRRGGARVRLVLHRPGHRGGQGAPGQGPRRRRRGGGPRGDRHGILAGGRRAGVRRAPRGGGAGRVDGRGVPAHRRRRHGAVRRRLRPRDDAPTSTRRPPRSTPSRPPTSTSSSRRRSSRGARPHGCSPRRWSRR